MLNTLAQCQIYWLTAGFQNTTPPANINESCPADTHHNGFGLRVLSPWDREIFYEACNKLMSGSDYNQMASIRLGNEAVTSGLVLPVRKRRGKLFRLTPVD